ncbi:hypothetical protein NQ315_000150 [Exocentrus adspersus]|uniref:G-patch domain-containing protein n=1 Tax=Exocentrus adspersus TaxID=1586481 RepID=A0AAV8VQI3_9CUCU|nr:hypothetical protein NQ315_000150 [Exocentrus adspersus]
MSMLAERKRKQKWSLNPRGKDWVQDSNKFGQKMLERMGWQHGKGLGAKEDGITEHVKVSYKNDSKGMGYKDSNDQWTEHETNFSALLEQLSGTKPVEGTKLNSLEKKSQSSRARVHYHKFTRGKDLSRYSEKDLANIFGKKSLKDVQVVEPDCTKEKSENEAKFLHNAGSMLDYFKKKLPVFGKSEGYVIGRNGVLKKQESDSETETRPSFNFKSAGEDEDMDVSYAGFGFLAAKSETKPAFYVNEGSSSSTEGKNKKKRVLEGMDLDNAFSPRKKTRKNKNSNSEGVSNPSFNPLGTPMKIQKHVLDTIEEGSCEDVAELDVVPPLEQKKHLFESSSSNTQEDKQKYKKSNAVSGLVNDAFAEEDVVDLTSSNADKENTADFPSYEVKRKKSKKKSKEIVETIEESKKKEIESVSIDLTSDDSNVKEMSLKTKKKKGKGKDIFVDNPCFDDVTETTVDLTQVEENPYEVKVKKKNKKSKRTHTDLNYNESAEDSTNVSRKRNCYAIENPNFNDSFETSTSTTVEENPYEVKPKKKQKKNKPSLQENPSFNQVMEISSDTEAKPKKKKKKKEVVAVENLSFNPNDTPELSMDNNTLEEDSKLREKKGVDNPVLETSLIEDSDLVLNVVATPILKKTPVENTYSSSSKRRKTVRFSDVTRQKTIPNNDELRDTLNRNELFEINTQVINRSLEEETKKRKLGVEENYNAFSKTIDRYEAEIENDINEKKLQTLSIEDIMVGDVGNPHGDNERLPEGTKLKFKYASVDAKTAFFHLDKTGAKKSYKHLIKGDIVVGFRNTNLHEIKGYAVKANSVSV